MAKGKSRITRSNSPPRQKGKRRRKARRGEVEAVSVTSENEDEALERIEREKEAKEKKVQKLFKKYENLLERYEIRLQKWQNRILDKAYNETVNLVLGVKKINAFYLKPDITVSDSTQTRIASALQRASPKDFYDSGYFEKIAKPGWIGLEPLIKIANMPKEGEMLDLRLPSNRLKLREEYLKGEEKENFKRELSVAINKYKQIYLPFQPKKPKFPRGLTQADFQRLSSPEEPELLEGDESENDEEDE